MINSPADPSRDRLVLAAAALAMRALKLMKGKHSRKTASFAKACFAFCHITIPSVDSSLARLNLFRLCGEVALRSACLSQADTFYKAAVKEITDVPEFEGEERERERERNSESRKAALCTVKEANATSSPIVPPLRRHQWPACRHRASPSHLPARLCGLHGGCPRPP